MRGGETTLQVKFLYQLLCALYPSFINEKYNCTFSLKIYETVRNFFREKHDMWVGMKFGHYFNKEGIILVVMLINLKTLQRIINTSEWEEWK